MDGPRYIDGRLAKTPFEKCYEAPGPAIYDDATKFGSFAEFVNEALKSLDWWQGSYRDAVLAFVLFPADVKRGLSLVECRKLEPLERFRQQQIELMHDDGAFAEAIECNGFARECGWPWGGNTTLERLRQKTPPNLVDHWDTVLDEVVLDTRKDEASFLDTGVLTVSVPYRDGVVSTEEEKIRKRFADHAEVFGCEPSSIGVGEDFDGTKWQESEADLESRFVKHAAVGRLLTNCLDAKSIQTYRWMVDLEDDVNLIREAYLAGIRFWIQRILSKRVPFQSPDDFAAFDRLAQVVLGIVREAYTREAPSTLLGIDECDILRLAFPLMSPYPAETWVDDNELRDRWDAFTADDRAEFENSFAEFMNEHRFFGASHFAKVLDRFHTEPSKHEIRDTDFECARVGLAFTNWVRGEATRIAPKSPFPAADIGDEQDALRIVRQIALECANLPNLNFALAPVETTSEVETKIDPQMDSPDKPDIADPDEVEALLWLLSKNAFSMPAGFSAPKIFEALTSPVRLISVELATFQTKLTKLQERGLMKCGRGRSSRRYLTGKGRKVTQQLKAKLNR